MTSETYWAVRIGKVRPYFAISDTDKAPVLYHSMRAAREARKAILSHCGHKAVYAVKVTLKEQGARHPMSELNAALKAAMRTFNGDTMEEDERLERAIAAYLAALPKQERDDDKRDILTGEIVDMLAKLDEISRDLDVDTWGLPIYGEDSEALGVQERERRRVVKVKLVESVREWLGTIRLPKQEPMTIHTYAEQPEQIKQSGVVFGPRQEPSVEAIRAGCETLRPEKGSPAIQDGSMSMYVDIVTRILKAGYAVDFPRQVQPLTEPSGERKKEMAEEFSSVLPNDHPMMKAWKEFCETDEFKSALRWAVETKYDDGRPVSDIQREQHAKGSMWLAFTKGMEYIEF